MKKKVLAATIILVFCASFAVVTSAYSFAVEGTVTGIAHYEGSGKVFITVVRSSDQVEFSKALQVTGGDFAFTKQGLAMALTSLSMGSASVVKVEIQNGVIVGITMQ